MRHILHYAWYKVDGCSISDWYEGYMLEAAITRGQHKTTPTLTHLELIITLGINMLWCKVRIFASFVFQSLEDHHLEVVAFFRENGFHGLLAHDSEYALYNIPSYYSSHALKLSWNGKNLTTNQFLMQEVAKQLGLKRMNFPIFAALLGNHILPDEDLAAFHWSLLGPEHPLASLKVRAHQLVLPPCDVVIKAVSEYVSSIKDPSNLDVVGKDVFKQSQSRTEDKIERFKKAVEYYSVTTKLSSLPVGPSSFLGFRNNRLGNPPLPRNQMGTISGGKPMVSIF
ncbi:Constitutive coactivator of PPAR-gamma-like protein 2 [Camelus dromedarius]|uniref:Constitutive coactivator of PPAR-gamma-like protein 2 n=1 Tax=Camelus dromedarius TaxID=9838 RepID=A0A5N4C1Y4_CAMDR|nr:Constitutive coactivator of PPAR-gamma-like protein 2 [Camelus dromedarius]